MVFKTCKNLDKEQLKDELLESKRIDRRCFRRDLNKELIRRNSKMLITQSQSIILIDLIGVL